MEQDSGIGVLDKAVAILDAISAEPASLAELVARTGMPRATVHRLAVALEHHGLAARDASQSIPPGAADGAPRPAAGGSHPRSAPVA